MEKVRDFGEKGFIRALLSRYASTARPGHLDDCIVIDPQQAFGVPDLPYVVYSMDHPSPIDRPLPEGMHWRYYGRWVAACTCNDVLAMGGRPRGFSLDLALPADTELTPVAQLYQGIADVLEAYGAVMEGGNTDINDRVETVAMCWGTVSRAGVIRRGGARPGDVIAVTTELGVGWASFLLRKRGGWDRLTPGTREELAEYNLMPLAPQHRAVAAAADELPRAITSGMDLSDGLVEFLYTIEEASGCGAIAEERLIPVNATLAECAAALEVHPPLLAIEYGYDMPRAHGYTVDPARWDDLVKLFDAYGARLHPVGTVTEQPGVVWRSAGGGTTELPKIWDDKCHRQSVIDRWTEFVGGLDGWRGQPGRGD